MALIKVETKIAVICSKCGGELNARLGGDYPWSDDKLFIEPCDTCMKDAKQEGIDSCEIVKD